MSLLKAIKAQLGLSNTPANNFTLDASADNGTLKLARGNAGATTQDILTVDANGRVAFTQGQSSVGYVSGQGGAVTQLTSKSTTVTLNKPSGQITMSSAALGAGARVIFQVNNSSVTYKDIVLATYIDDFGTCYRVDVQTVWNGYFQIGVTNITAESLSHAVRINFAILKGAVE